MGGIQHFEAATPIQLLEVLSTSYGSLFQQWKIVMAQNKSLRARLSKLKHIFPITRINAQHAIAVVVSAMPVLTS